MISSSSTLPLPSLLALSTLLFSPAAAELWNPRIHVTRRDYVAPRTTEVVPRPLRIRADNSTVQPGQPAYNVTNDLILGFEIVGTSGVSAQQLFLGDDTKVPCRRLLVKNIRNKLRFRFPGLYY
jgi:hypothetical protein